MHLAIAVALLAAVGYGAFSIWVGWVYLSYIRARRAYFLSLTAEQIEAFRLKRKYVKLQPMTSEGK